MLFLFGDLVFLKQLLLLPESNIRQASHLNNNCRQNCRKYPILKWHCFSNRTLKGLGLTPGQALLGTLSFAKDEQVRKAVSNHKFGPIRTMPVRAQACPLSNAFPCPPPPLPLPLQISVNVLSK